MLFFTAPSLKSQISKLSNTDLIHILKESGFESIRWKEVKNGELSEKSRKLWGNSEEIVIMQFSARKKLGKKKVHVPEAPETEIDYIVDEHGNCERVVKVKK